MGTAPDDLLSVFYDTVNHSISIVAEDEGIDIRRESVAEISQLDIKTALTWLRDRSTRACVAYDNQEYPGSWATTSSPGYDRNWETTGIAAGHVHSYCPQQLSIPNTHAILRLSM